LEQFSRGHGGGAPDEGGFFNGQESGDLRDFDSE